MSDDKKVRVNIDFWSPLWFFVIGILFTYGCTDACKFEGMTDKVKLFKCLGMYCGAIKRDFEDGKKLIIDAPQGQ